ncbi:caspase family protein [Actinoplanes sp. LDG1-06]|uniref:Caspase family protein n=1 Tax=Paractinoplanes ovalisporus TaxID=2810368 RepID=A0ABS2ACE8_9ACTN|nr:caspase family protein [Actinoplanes ovalisporus]MBM2617500.1 caspase family protein [Actinoplanes ovalisporus]
MGDGRYALVVAVDRYDHSELRKLRSPAADAQTLADVLGDEQLGGFTVDVQHNPTASEIAEHVESVLAARRSTDLVLVHFSCHGLKDDSGRLYLAASNTRPDRLKSTAVSSALIGQLMQDSRAQRVVLLLDCCYSGAFAHHLVHRSGSDVNVHDQFRQDDLDEGRGRVVITASTAMEYAFEGADLADGAAPQPSIFTRAVADGIRTGEADKDRDGKIGLTELYDYVYDRVRVENPNQNPTKSEFGVRGDIYVSRRPAHLRPVAARESAKGVPTPPGRTKVTRRFVLGAATVVTLLAAVVLALVVFRPGDPDPLRRYPELLSLLPAGIRGSCDPYALPKAPVGSSVLAICATARESYRVEFHLLATAEQLEVRKEGAVPRPDDCSGPPSGKGNVQPLPLVGRAGWLSCRPMEESPQTGEPAHYEVAWALEDLLFYCEVHTEGTTAASYTRAYAEARTLLEQIG